MSPNIASQNGQRACLEAWAFEGACKGMDLIAIADTVSTQVKRPLTLWERAVLVDSFADFIDAKKECYITGSLNYVAPFCLLPNFAGWEYL